VKKTEFTQDETAILKGLAQILRRYIDAEKTGGVNLPTKKSNQELLTADELARYLNISIKTIYYRSAKKSPNPFPFPCLRIGGCLRGRLRFKKADVDKALADGIL
jgi:predicted DNA-binding transcriptional regulator AlpA